MHDTLTLSSCPGCRSGDPDDVKDAGAVLVFVHANPTIVTFDPWYPYVKERVPLVESRGLEDKADLDIRAPRQLLRKGAGADPMWVAAEGPAHPPTEPQDQVIKEGQEAEAVEGTAEGMEGMEA